MVLETALLALLGAGSLFLNLHFVTKSDCFCCKVEADVDFHESKKEKSPSVKL